MSRILFASAATAALLVTGAAGAQQQTAGQQEQQATQEQQAQSLDKMETEAIIGMTVKASDGEDIGEVGSIVRGGADKIEALIIEQGGFIGIGENQFVLERGRIAGVTQDGILVDLPQDQIARLPRYKVEQRQRTETQPTEQAREQMGAREDEGQQQNQGAARAGGDAQVGFVADNGGDAPDQKAGALTPQAVDKDIEEGRTQQMLQRRAEGPVEENVERGPIDEDVAADVTIQDQQQQAQSSDQKRQQMEQDTAAVYPEAANNLIGGDAYSATNEDVGEVTDILVDDQGQPMAVVIAHGGWLGLGEKRIAIEWDQVTVTPEGVRVKMPSEQISELPEYEGDIE